MRKSALTAEKIYLKKQALPIDYKIILTYIMNICIICL